jgi:capsule polysaccharide export protein KpsE/RkpR
VLRGQEALAVLKSKGYARQFITDEQLMPALFTQAGPFDDRKDVRDAIRIFDDKVRSVEQDRRTGLVTVTMTWTDPARAASWANDFVRTSERPIARGGDPRSRA